MDTQNKRYVHAYSYEIIRLLGHGKGDYLRLLDAGIRIPKMLDVDEEQEII